MFEHRLEQRAAVRYKLRLPVIFYWNDGQDHVGAGFTSDVALDGVLILSSTCPQLGFSVRIEMLIPSPDHIEEELRIECVGTVTHVVELVGYVAFGVQGTFDDDHLTRRVLL